MNGMKGFFRTVQRGVAGFAVTALLSGAAYAASDYSFSSIDAYHNGAGVHVSGNYTFTATTDDGDGLDLVTFEIWDDFVTKFTQDSYLAVGQTQSFAFNALFAGPVGDIMPGIGLFLVDNGEDAMFEDPVFAPYREVPLPGTLALLGLGLFGVGATRFQRRSGAA